MTGKQTGAPRGEHGLGYSVVSELSSNHRNKNTTLYLIIHSLAQFYVMICTDMISMSTVLHGCTEKACLYIAAQFG